MDKPNKSQQHALVVKKDSEPHPGLPQWPQAAGWGSSFFSTIWDLWVAFGALCLVLGSPVTWNVPIYSSGDSYFGLYTSSTSTERTSHSWGWASAHITEGSKHLGIFNGKVVLQIPVSLFDDHIHAKECLRQPLGRDKGLCVQAVQAEGIKAERLCLIFTIIISINNCVQLCNNCGSLLGLLEEPPWNALSL